MSTPIKKGEELLASYGKGFWKCRKNDDEDGDDKAEDGDGLH
jgi:hypothetical protein